MSDWSRRLRVLVGESVFEDATVTFTAHDRTLWVEFDSDDLDNIAIPLGEASLPIVGRGSGIDDFLAAMYGYSRRDGQSDAIIPVPAALIQEARDSSFPGDAQSLLTRVLKVAGIEGEAPSRGRES